MANYKQTTAAINSQIKANGNREISGQILQNVLNTIVNNLKQGYLLVGIATPGGNPGTPDQNVCWLATNGTYKNYGNITVGNGKLAVIKYNGTWTYDTVDVQGAIKSGDGIDVDPESGEVSVNVGDGLQIAGGKVAAKVGDGMQIADGSIAANVGDGLQIAGGKVAAKVGDGMQIADGSIAANVGDGLQIAGGKSAVNAGNGIKIEDGKVAIDLIAGSYINIENGNKINCTLDANPFYVVDELPEAPPEGLNNKLWLVPVSGQLTVDLYKWNEETSQFDKVGTITLDVNTALFIKKGVNDITEPLELVTEEGIGSTGEMLYLRNKNGARIGIILKFGDDTNISRSSGLQAVKDRDGNPSIALKCVLSSLKLSQDGTLRLSANNFMEGMPIRPTFYIEAPSGQNWDNLNTFNISGIYNRLKTALDLNADVVLTYPSRQVAIETDLQSFGDGQDIEFTYRFAGLRFALEIKSDDSVTIVSKADVWRFNAADYGINAWYNASGKNQTLYKDLRDIINGDNNKDGILGYLCDNNNTFVITGINVTTSGSITTLTVSFTEANSQCQDTLIIDSTGAFSVRRWPKLKVLWADNYNLIASGMPRPDAWLVADGTDVLFYNEVSEAYKYGYQLILKEYSYGSSSCNQYTVKNIIPGGTGYSLFYESGGRQYMLTINANGSMSTVCNVFNASDYGLSSWAQSASGTNIALAQKLSACFNYNWPIIFKTATNAYPATTLFKDGTSMRFFYDDGSLDLAGSNFERGTASLTIDASTGEYVIAVQ